MFHTGTLLLDFISADTRQFDREHGAFLVALDADMAPVFVNQIMA